jgi:two-component system CheB/CheR fusion protein
MPEEPSQEKDLGQLLTSALIDSYTPTALLINRKNEILYHHGQTGSYLDYPQGEPTSDLFALLREGLSSRVRAAVHRVQREGEPATVKGVPMARNGDTRRVSFTVRPLSD